MQRAGFLHLSYQIVGFGSLELDTTSHSHQTWIVTPEVAFRAAGQLVKHFTTSSTSLISRDLNSH